MATLGSIRSEDVTRKFIQKYIDHWKLNGYGLWVFRDRQDDQFAGRAGLQKVSVNGNEEIELAYALFSEYWGKGLATEMAKAIMEVAFGHLGLTEVVCFTLETNKASRRVMEKVGFKYDCDFERAGLLHVLFRILKEESPSLRGNLVVYN